MEVGWILASVDRRALFSGFRVKVWWGGAQVVATASSPTKFFRFQPYLDGDVEKLVGVVWS
jgi:hypothetical protein